MSSVKLLRSAAINVSITLLVALVMVMAASNNQIFWSVQLNQDSAGLKSYNSSFARLEESHTSKNNISWQVVADSSAVRDEIKKKVSLGDHDQHLFAAILSPSVLVDRAPHINEQQDERPQTILFFAADRSPPAFFVKTRDFTESNLAFPNSQSSLREL